MKRYQIAGTIREVKATLADGFIILAEFATSVWFYVDADSAAQAVERAEFLCPDLEIRSVVVE